MGVVTFADQQLVAHRGFREYGKVVAGGHRQGDFGNVHAENAA